MPAKTKDERRQILRALRQKTRLPAEVVGNMLKACGWDMERAEQALLGGGAPASPPGPPPPPPPDASDSPQPPVEAPVPYGDHGSPYNYGPASPFSEGPQPAFPQREAARPPAVLPSFDERGVLDAPPSYVMQMRRGSDAPPAAHGSFPGAARSVHSAMGSPQRSPRHAPQYPEEYRSVPYASDTSPPVHFARDSSGIPSGTLPQAYTSAAFAMSADEVEQHRRQQFEAEQYEQQQHQQQEYYQPEYRHSGGPFQQPASRPEYRHSGQFPQQQESQPEYRHSGQFQQQEFRPEYRHSGQFQQQESQPEYRHSGQFQQQESQPEYRHSGQFQQQESQPEYRHSGQFQQQESQPEYRHSGQFQQQESQPEYRHSGQFQQQESQPEYRHSGQFQQQESQPEYRHSGQFQQHESQPEYRHSGHFPQAQQESLPERRQSGQFEQQASHGHLQDSEEARQPEAFQSAPQEYQQGEQPEHLQSQPVEHQEQQGAPQDSYPGDAAQAFQPLSEPQLPASQPGARRASAGSRSQGNAEPPLSEPQQFASNPPGSQPPPTPPVQPSSTAHPPSEPASAGRRPSAPVAVLSQPGAEGRVGADVPGIKQNLASLDANLHTAQEGLQAASLLAAKGMALDEKNAGPIVPPSFVQAARMKALALLNGQSSGLGLELDYSGGSARVRMEERVRQEDELHRERLGQLQLEIDAVRQRKLRHAAGGAATAADAAPAGSWKTAYASVATHLQPHANQQGTAPHPQDTRRDTSPTRIPPPNPGPALQLQQLQLQQQPQQQPQQQHHSQPTHQQRPPPPQTPGSQVSQQGEGERPGGPKTRDARDEEGSAVTREGGGAKKEEYDAAVATWKVELEALAQRKDGDLRQQQDAFSRALAEKTEEQKALVKMFRQRISEVQEEYESKLELSKEESHRMFLASPSYVSPPRPARHNASATPVHSASKTHAQILRASRRAPTETPAHLIYEGAKGHQLSPAGNALAHSDQLDLDVHNDDPLGYSDSEVERQAEAARRHIASLTKEAGSPSWAGPPKHLRKSRKLSKLRPPRLSDSESEDAHEKMERQPAFAASEEKRGGPGKRAGADGSAQPQPAGWLGCPTCRATVSAAANFCGACGHPVRRDGGSSGLAAALAPAVGSAPSRRHVHPRQAPLDTPYTPQAGFRTSPARPAVPLEKYLSTNETLGFSKRQLDRMAYESRRAGYIAQQPPSASPASFAAFDPQPALPTDFTRRGSGRESPAKKQRPPRSGAVTPTSLGPLHHSSVPHQQHRNYYGNIGPFQ
ncbi:hypothetical protein DIPPA_16887 [Diplonema papillatum]|nr:hypothetical protein DIPPA_16887 [Diplonema papillatum]